MKYVMIVLLAVLGSFPAAAVYVRAEDEQASRELAVSLGFVGFGAAYTAEGNLYAGGTCALICNSERNGAWILTAHHVTTDSNGLGTDTYAILKYGFAPNCYQGFDQMIPADMTKVFYPPNGQDMALIKLQSLVYESDGTLKVPLNFYKGILSLGQTILFSGYGANGDPSNGGSGECTRDGYVRAARGQIHRFDYLGMDPSIAFLEYLTSLLVPGIGSCHDSGAPALIETETGYELAGVVVKGRGADIGTWTGFERVDYDPNFMSWVYDMITENSTSPEGEIEGEGEIRVLHPADINEDFRIVIGEAIGYLAGWQQGSNPIAYAIRAVYLWQNGEDYTYNSEAAPPLCWILIDN